MINGPRRLDEKEVATLLALDLPAHLATLDRAGFPHVTPLWFVWEDGAFFMTSIADRPHLGRLSRNPNAGLAVDIEEPERADGQRPNRQIRAIGQAELFPDRGAAWTNRITAKYLSGPARAERIAARAADERLVICLRPSKLVAVGSLWPTSPRPSG